MNLEQASKWNKRAIADPLLAILLGMIVGAILMLIVGYNPWVAYSSMVSGVFGTLYDLGETLRAITPLIFTGLAVAFAFRTGLFNIGVEGQFIVGQLAATVVGLTLHLPWPMHVLVALILGGIAGGLWAAIPGLLKAKLKVHEVITTIMMNYIALSFSNFIIRAYLTENTDSTEKIQQTASLQLGWLTAMFDDARINAGLFIGLLMLYVMYILLWKTTFGYELRAVGFNPSASEYAGISVSKNIVLSMIISGLFAGLGGASQLLGVDQYMAISSSFTGIGFDGIAVALIGANAPLGILFGASLFGMLTYGSGNMQLLGIPQEIIRVVIALMIFFLAASGLIRWLFGGWRRKTATDGVRGKGEV